MILVFSKYCKPSVDTKCTFASKVTGTRQNHKFCQLLVSQPGNCSILASQFAFVHRLKEKYNSFAGTDLRRNEYIIANIASNN